jgi:hypothetical protein
VTRRPRIAGLTTLALPSRRALAPGGSPVAYALPAGERYPRFGGRATPGA